MTKFIIFAALLGSGAANAATQLISYVGGRSVSGFAEDGFNTPNAVCFLGEINGVCRLIEEHSGQNSRDHGWYDVTSCTRQGSVVELKYQKRNDYGDDIAINLIVESCSGDQR